MKNSYRKLSLSKNYIWPLRPVNLSKVPPCSVLNITSTLSSLVIRLIRLSHSIKMSFSQHSYLERIVEYRGTNPSSLELTSTTRLKLEINEDWDSFMRNESWSLTDWKLSYFKFFTLSTFIKNQIPIFTKLFYNYEIPRWGEEKVTKMPSFRLY